MSAPVIVLLVVMGVLGMLSTTLVSIPLLLVLVVVVVPDTAPVSIVEEGITPPMVGGEVSVIGTRLGGG